MAPTKPRGEEVMGTAQDRIKRIERQLGFSVIQRERKISEYELKLWRLCLRLAKRIEELEVMPKGAAGREGRTDG